jgi:hypothetical protein
MLDHKNNPRTGDVKPDTVEPVPVIFPSLHGDIQGDVVVNLVVAKWLQRHW